MQPRRTVSRVLHPKPELLKVGWRAPGFQSRGTFKVACAALNVRRLLGTAYLGVMGLTTGTGYDDHRLAEILADVVYQIHELGCDIEAAATFTNCLAPGNGH